MAKTDLDGARSSVGRPPVWLVVGFGLFLAVLGYLVASSLTRRSAPTFGPSPVGVPIARFTPGRPDTVTMDARNESEWRYLDLDSGIAPASGDSTGWDLAMQRFRVRAAHGASDLGITSLEAPRDLDSLMRSAEPTARELGRWYSYGAMSHLLEPAGRLFLVLTDQHRIALVEIVSYYCPGLQAGCLTLRYLLSPQPSLH